MRLSNKVNSNRKFETEDSGRNVDTVKISVNITNKPAIEFDPINEEEAINLAQSVAKDYNGPVFWDVYKGNYRCFEEYYLGKQVL